jgi:hypothetical protein
MSRRDPQQPDTSVDKERMLVDVNKFEDAKEMLRPARPVSEIGKKAYATVEIHPDNAEKLEDLAANRAPTDESEEQHLTGVCCEFAAATLFHAKINQKVYSGFQGDDGYDFTDPQKESEANRIEVKGTRKWGDPKRIIAADKIGKADYYVLCRTRRPKHVVEVFGAASRIQVEFLGRRWGNDGYCLHPDYLSPVGPARIREEETKKLAREIY